MNQFEKAANEVDREYYTGDSMQENVIEFVRGSQVATANFCVGRLASRVKKLAEERPDECQIVHENKDGSVVAHFPVKWVKINPTVILTDEQRAERVERAKRVFHGGETH